jgi:hypothetical protein
VVALGGAVATDARLAGMGTGPQCQSWTGHTGAIVLSRHAGTGGRGGAMSFNVPSHLLAVDERHGEMQARKGCRAAGEMAAAAANGPGGGPNNLKLRFRVLRRYLE